MPLTQPGIYSPLASTDAGDWYLRLLELCLTGLVVPEPITAVRQPDGSVVKQPLRPSELDKRFEGTEVWPADSFTMIGVRRLENVRGCVQHVLSRKVPGDLIEAGVWRGGTAIFMRALLAMHSAHDRLVFAADSYAGLPAPDADRYPADVGHNFNLIPFLSVPLEEVRGNFAKFGLLDDQVRFVEGWFADTLPALSDRKWSVIRLDADLYESTTNALEHLYPNLSVGGFLIVDDYNELEPCRLAVDDYRREHGIREEIIEVDASCVFWQRTQ